MVRKLPGAVTTNRAIYADGALSMGRGCDRSESGEDEGNPMQGLEGCRPVLTVALAQMEVPESSEHTVQHFRPWAMGALPLCRQTGRRREEEGRRLCGWTCLRELTDATLFCFLNAIL